jgi:hypothetical protein
MTRQVKIIELFSRINFIVQLWSNRHVIIPSELLRGPIHVIRYHRPKVTAQNSSTSAKLSYQDLRTQMPRCSLIPAKLRNSSFRLTCLQCRRSLRLSFQSSITRFTASSPHLVLSALVVDHRISHHPWFCGRQHSWVSSAAWMLYHSPFRIISSTPSFLDS